MRNGRGSLIASKMIALLIVVLLSTVLFWGSTFISSFIVNQPENLSAPLQSVLGYDRSSLNVNTSEYLLLFLTSKILITALISLLILYFILRSKQTSVLYACIGVVFLAAYILRVMIPGDSTLGILHYVNLFPFLSVYPVFKFFFNVNIFGLPVAMSTVFFTITSLLLFLSLFV